MKDKKTFIKVLVIVIVLIAIIIGNFLYNKYNYFEEKLICNYNSRYTNYSETIKFNFVDDTLYEYERNEVMEPSGSSTLDELYEFFLSEQEKVKDNMNDNFQYDVTKGSNEVIIRTYIKTIFNEDFYNSYIEEKGITMTSTIEEIEEKLGDDYTCIIKKVR